MKSNLNKIAKELYGKIQTRFSDIKIGDEHAEVLSKKEDIPKARFFEFEYKDNGRSLGTIAITLDEDDGVVVQISGNLADRKHPGAYKFIRSFRQFAKDRLLNFDVQNIGKNNLDKRDYTFQAKAKEETPMEPIMENRLYGTARMSYQDLGEATLIIKHSQPVNPDLAAGRTMHIESIYVENSQGERFKYPFKHLSGARAMAEHLKHGGIPYDSIGKHITSLSEELAQLRKFKGYVGRNEALSEAMGDITNKVMERIEEIKKEVQGLQRPAYYEQFAESFEDREEQMIPEEIMSDWIDRLTIRTFNEELKTAFPYIFRLVDESSIPVKELNPDDLLSEMNPIEKELGKDLVKPLAKDAELGASKTAQNDIWYKGNTATVGRLSREVEKMAEDKLGEIRALAKQVELGQAQFPAGYASHLETELWAVMSRIKDGSREAFEILGNIRAVAQQSQRGAPLPKNFANTLVNELWHAITLMREKVVGESIGNPEDAFENFLDSIVNEDESSESGQGIFDQNETTRDAAVQQLNDIFKSELKGGVAGINIIDTLKDLIPDNEFLEKMKDIDPDLDARAAIEAELVNMSHDNEDLARAVTQINFHGGDDEVGGEDEVSAETPPAPDATTPPPEAVPNPAPDATAPPPAPPAPPAGAPAPVAEGTARLKAKLIRVLEAGATLDTKLDFGYRVMTLGEAMEECGMSMQDHEPHGDPTHDILKSIAGFWNPKEKNFTVGGTRAKIRVLKGFKDGEFPHAQPEHVKKVIEIIEKMDPSTGSHGHGELGHIKKLAGVKGAMDEEQQAQFDLNALMSQLQALQNDPEAQKQLADQGKQMIGQQLQKVQGQAPDQTVQFPGGQMNPAELMKGILSKIGS